MLTELEDFARRYTQAWCSRDAASVAAFFSEHGSLSVNDGIPAVGRPAIAAIAQGFMSAFPDLEVMMDDVEEHPDRAVYRWTLAGTNSGPGGTGHRVRIGGFEIWRFGADGLIAASEGNFDNDEYQRQLEHGLERAVDS